ncbi:uncharacterized protein LOC778976 [Ciona intestinalis]
MDSQEYCDQATYPYDTAEIIVPTKAAIQAAPVGNGTDFHKNGCVASEIEGGEKDGEEKYQVPNSFVRVQYEDLQFHECCGEGTFGSVYRAIWVTQGKQEVAVKKLNQMEKEAHVLSVLSHRNVIQFYGACVDAPNFCIVTEYAPYGSLFDFLATKESEKLEFSQLLSWSRDIGLGMNYLHEEAPVAVIHRDLKSKNVVICSDFTLKICDFGASRFFGETIVMTITGTYPWMAPELIQGLPTSELCDVYSFGVVLWEMLTREVPFKGLQGFQVAWVVVENGERPTIPECCPGRFSSLMRRCWSSTVSERPSFYDIIGELNSMMSDDDLGATTNHFLGSKEEWKSDIEEKRKELQEKEKELGVKEKEMREREEKLKEWEQKLRQEMRKQTLIGVARYNKKSENLNCKISGTGEGAIDSVKDVLSHIMSNSGMHSDNQTSRFGSDFHCSSPGFESSDRDILQWPLSRQGSASSAASSNSSFGKSGSKFTPLTRSSPIGFSGSRKSSASPPSGKTQKKFPHIESDINFDKSETNKSMDVYHRPGGSFGEYDEFHADEQSENDLPKFSGWNGKSSNFDGPQVQKQVSSSSEEYNFEGSKVSRSTTSGEGLAGGGVRMREPEVQTWETAKGDAKVNKSNEKFGFEGNSDSGFSKRATSPTTRKVSFPDASLEDRGNGWPDMNGSSGIDKLKHNGQTLGDATSKDAEFRSKLPGSLKYQVLKRRPWESQDEYSSNSTDITSPVSEITSSHSESKDVSSSRRAERKTSQSFTEMPVITSKTIISPTIGDTISSFGKTQSEVSSNNSEQTSTVNRQRRSSKSHRSSISSGGVSPVIEGMNGVGESMSDISESCESSEKTSVKKSESRRSSRSHDSSVSMQQLRGLKGDNWEGTDWVPNTEDPSRPQIKPSASSRRRISTGYIPDRPIPKFPFEKVAAKQKREEGCQTDKVEFAQRKATREAETETTVNKKDACSQTEPETVEKPTVALPSLSSSSCQTEPRPLISNSCQTNPSPANISNSSQTNPLPLQRYNCCQTDAPPATYVSCSQTEDFLCAVCGHFFTDSQGLTARSTPTRSFTNRTPSPGLKRRDHRASPDAAVPPIPPSRKQDRALKISRSEEDILNSLERARVEDDTKLLERPRRQRAILDHYYNLYCGEDKTKSGKDDTQINQQDTKVTSSEEPNYYKGGFLRKPRSILPSYYRRYFSDTGLEAHSKYEDSSDGITIPTTVTQPPKRSQAREERIEIVERAWLGRSTSLPGGKFWKEDWDTGSENEELGSKSQRHAFGPSDRSTPNQQDFSQVRRSTSASPSNSYFAPPPSTDSGCYEEIQGSGSESPAFSDTHHFTGSPLVGRISEDEDGRSDARIAPCVPYPDDHSSSASSLGAKTTQLPNNKTTKDAHRRPLMTSRSMVGEIKRPSTSPTKMENQRKIKPSGIGRISPDKRYIGRTSPDKNVATGRVSPEKKTNTGRVSPDKKYSYLRQSSPDKKAQKQTSGMSKRFVAGAQVTLDKGVSRRERESNLLPQNGQTRPISPVKTPSRPPRVIDKKSSAKVTTRQTSENSTASKTAKQAADSNLRRKGEDVHPRANTPTRKFYSGVQISGIQKPKKYSGSQQSSGRSNVPDRGATRSPDKQLKHPSAKTQRLTPENSNPALPKTTLGSDIYETEDYTYIIRPRGKRTR